MTIAIFVSIISIFICGLLLFEKRNPMPDIDSIRGILVGVQALLWVVALFVLTFDSMFKNTGNGFFATWMGFLVSLQIFASVVEEILKKEAKAPLPTAGTQQQASPSPVLVVSTVKVGQFYFKGLDRIKALGWKLGFLFLASLILLIAGIVECSSDECDGKGVFTFIGGLLSLVFIIGMFIVGDKLNQTVRLVLHGENFVLWICLAVLTFIGPFESTGNGYFASWVGFFCSGLLVTKHY